MITLICNSVAYGCYVVTIIVLLGRIRKLREENSELGAMCCKYMRRSLELERKVIVLESKLRIAERERENDD